ncbi:MAG: hypothetical protein KatS3mg022_1212 [Armatimonadota bacterium]|jgi:hypothetical protein|nr:MAG: hypothetical protein KatS3mg022_1212 [Armatimonadota bacterium]GIV20181.1 MAG: hypothetical protein KatS3mg023_1932 [Armatimonadota bacterium]
MRQKMWVMTVAFLGGWTSVSLQQWWQARDSARQACEVNLRILYATVQTLAQQGNIRDVTVEQIAIALRDGIRLSPKLEAYIAGSPEASDDQHARGTLLMGAQTALVCPSDPDFAVKAMLSRSPALGFESSYRLFPDLHTVAVCPYHRHAVWSDGTLHRE